MKTAGGGILIFCPYGCRVEVREEHRGMTGSCPRCQAPFIVPIHPPRFKKRKSEQEGSVANDKFRFWIPDTHLHIVSLEKLKLKADSLVKEFTEADVAFSEDQILIAILARKGGSLFGKSGEKASELRESLRQHLREGKSLEEFA